MSSHFTKMYSYEVSTVYIKSKILSMLQNIKTKSIVHLTKQERVRVRSIHTTKYIFSITNVKNKREKKLVGKNLHRLHLILVGDRNAFTVKLEKYILREISWILNGRFPSWQGPLLFTRGKRFSTIFWADMQVMTQPEPEQARTYVDPR